MCDQVSKVIDDEKCSNYFVKLLVLSNDNKDFTLLYGFCVPTKQASFPWRFRNTETKQHITIIQDGHQHIFAPNGKCTFLKNIYYNIR